MDGLVTKALQDLVRTRFDDAAWDDVLSGAGLAPLQFLGGQVYPDEMLFRLVDAAAQRGGMTRTQVLEALGEHWVDFAIREGYGRFLTVAGRTFRDVLMNLNQMHDRIALKFPHVRQPSFWCTDLAADSLVLHYTSTRQGLAPMVIGIVRGLAKMHWTRVEVEHKTRCEDGAPHDEFLVRMENA